MRATCGFALAAFAASHLGCGRACHVATEYRMEDRMFMDEQRPQDPGAVGDMMTGMKRQADEVIARVEAGRDASVAYQRGALEIMRHMRPRFGPANAWLFNERGAKLAALAEKLGVGAEAAEASFPEHVYETFVDQFDALVTIASECGLAADVRVADRAELLWSPLCGLAASVTDASVKVRHRPPYAGTVAGPDVPEIETHPRLTLYCFPPVEGSAEMGMMTREQPGVPAFYAGELVAFTLQEPQSGDVEPEHVLARLAPELRRAGLVRQLDDEARAAIFARLPGTPHESDGIVRVTSDEAAPAEATLPFACALVWTRPGGATSRVTLKFPQAQE